LNTYLKLDAITVSFRDENGNLCSLRKAKSYKRERPKSWRDQDFYLVVHADGEAYVNIEGSGAAVILNEESVGNLPLKDLPLKKATNKFVITSNGKIYTFTVHLVTVKASQREDQPESGSRAISYDNNSDCWVFDDMGFFQSMFWLFQDAYEEEDCRAEFSIEGVNEDQFEQPPFEQEGVEQGQQDQGQPQGQDLSLAGESEKSGEPSVAETVYNSDPVPTHHSAPEPTHYSAPEPTHHYSAPEPSHSYHSDHSSYDSGGGGYDGGGGDCGGGCDGGGGGGD
jgi:uncharacterized membrane protein YgcG